MSQKIRLRDAARIAIEFIGEVFKDAGLSDIRLEEVQFVHELNGEPGWEVTISFVRTNTSTAVAQALGREVEREFKTVVVSADTGEVEALRMRELAQ